MNNRKTDPRQLTFAAFAEQHLPVERSAMLADFLQAPWRAKSLAPRLL